MLATFIRREEIDSAELPLNETASAWIEQHGLDLDRMTPEQLLAELRDVLMDEDITRNGLDLDAIWETL